jgi:hypothetical protein
LIPFDEASARSHRRARCVDEGPKEGGIMARSKARAHSPFEGRWHIVSMSMWDEDFINAEEQGYIEFNAGGEGEFHFGYVHGNMDCREATRDGQPAAEWSWEGNDEMDEASGRGWAVLRGGELHGLLAFHQGDESDFVAKRP